VLVGADSDSGTGVERKYYFVDAACVAWRRGPSLFKKSLNFSKAGAILCVSCSFDLPSSLCRELL
jgi:hypothetical protein